MTIFEISPGRGRAPPLARPVELICFALIVAHAVNLSSAEDRNIRMTIELNRQLGPVYLRLQADRCQRLSRSCMDLGTARDLRLMAEEYVGEASRIEDGPGPKLH
jgi:hypothetical protein